MEKKELEKQQFGAALTYFVKRDGWGTKTNVARKAGVSGSYIGNIAAGKKRGELELRENISGQFDLKYEDMLDLGQHIINDRDPEEYFDMNKSLPDGVSFGKGTRIPKPRNIPIISWVQAGVWSEIVDQFEPGDADNFVIVFRNAGNNTFALRIVGDSMEPEFTSGDIIVVDPAVRPETSKFVIAKIKSDNEENGEATLKQFIRDGNHVYLKPINDKYELMDMTGKDFTIVGCVVSKTKEY